MSGDRFKALVSYTSDIVRAEEIKFAGRFARTAIQRVDSRAIVLGRDSDGVPLVLPDRARREHMHLIGATGSGKSNLISHMFRQDVVSGNGALLVDPHGNHPDSPFRTSLSWLFETGLCKKRVVHVIDPNAASHTVAFNPFDPSGTAATVSVIAEAVFEAFERMWGDEDGNTKPTIQRVLTATFTALGELGLTLADARLLFDPEDQYGIRELVLNKLEDRYAHDEIDWLHRIAEEKFGRKDFRGEVVGPINRIAKLVRAPAMRAVVGQTENVLNLRQAMDEGHIILCNLSGGDLVYEQSADLLGRLLTRFIFFYAKRRRQPERTFVTYLDECHRYLSGDVPSMLAEVRKYGVAIVAAHQWLAQLGEPDNPVREAVCKAPNIKVVFRIKDATEAKELAEAVTPLNLEMPVELLTKPTVVGHGRTKFFNGSVAVQNSSTITNGTAHATSESTSEGVSESTTHSLSVSETEGTTVSDSESVGSGWSEGNTWSVGDSVGISSGSSISRAATRDPYAGITNPRPLQAITDTRQSSAGADRSRSAGRGSSFGRSGSSSSGHSVAHAHATSVTHGIANTRGTSHVETRGATDTSSHSRGETTGTTVSAGFSEGIEPIYETLPTAVHGKDNVLHMAAQELLALPTGHARIAYVGPSGRVATRLRTPPVRSTVLDDGAFVALRQQFLERSPCAIPTVRAIAALEEREQRLIRQARQNQMPVEPKSFRVLAPPRRRAGV